MDCRLWDEISFSSVTCFWSWSFYHIIRKQTKTEHQEKDPPKPLNSSCNKWPESLWKECLYLDLGDSSNAYTLVSGFLWFWSCWIRSTCMVLLSSSSQKNHRLMLLAPKQTPLPFEVSTVFLPLTVCKLISFTMSLGILIVSALYFVIAHKCCATKASFKTQMSELLLWGYK